MPKRARGIFCLEGDWWGDLARSSTVKPVLKLLSQAAKRPVPFIYRDVGTVKELEYYLCKWKQRGFAAYPILNLAFHGDVGGIYVGDQRLQGSFVELDQLAEWFGPTLRGRVVHLGSCATMSTNKRNLSRFLKTTKAEAVTGYREDVDWLKSAAFETLFMHILLHGRLGDVERRVKTEVGGLARELGFRMVRAGR